VRNRNIIAASFFTHVCYVCPLSSILASEPCKQLFWRFISSVPNFRFLRKTLSYHKGGIVYRRIRKKTTGASYSLRAQALFTTIAFTSMIYDLYAYGTKGGLGQWKNQAQLFSTGRDGDETIDCI